MSENASSCAVAQPMVSVICHAYNHADYIAEALDSILSQDVSFPFEVIVHDDASLDSTAAIIRAYAQEYPTIIRPIFQPMNQYSRGLRPSRFTFPAAKGRYIALCEGDDLWTNVEKLGMQVALMENHPNVNFCFHSAVQLDVSSGKRRRHSYYGRKVKIFSVSDVLGKRSQFAPTASYFFRRDSIYNYPEFFFEDPALPYGDLFIECFSGTNGLLYIPDDMSIYRRNVPGSHTQRMNSASTGELLGKMESTVNFINRLKEFPEIPGSAVDRKAYLTRVDYCFRFILIGDYSAYCKALNVVQGGRWAERFFLGIAKEIRPVFYFYHFIIFFLHSWLVDKN